MAKAIRLVNVDEIHASDGKVVIWGDIYKAAQKENHKADGHSASASHGMRTGGYLGNASITVYAFASLSGTAFSATLTVGRNAHGSASDGTYVMVAGGQTVGSGKTDIVEMKYFKDPTAGTVSHGTITPEDYPMKGVSNGTIAMFGGTSHLSIKTFASDSFKTNFVKGSTGYGASATNGVVAFFQNSHFLVSSNFDTQSVTIKSEANLPMGYNYSGGAGNDSIAMFRKQDECIVASFDGSFTSYRHTGLTNSRSTNGISGCSDGDSAMFTEETGVDVVSFSSGHSYLRSWETSGLHRMPGFASGDY